MTDRAPFYDDDGIPMCESGDCAQYRTVAFGPRDGWCEEQQCDTEDECACFPELKELLAERTALLAKQNKENSDET